MRDSRLLRLCHRLLRPVSGATCGRGRVVINRLPPLPTDQTATVIQTETADPVATMLPIVREVQS